MPGCYRCQLGLDEERDAIADDTTGWESWVDCDGKRHLNFTITEATLRAMSREQMDDYLLGVGLITAVIDEAKRPENEETS